MDDLVHAVDDAFLAASRQAREMLDSGDGAAAERLLGQMVVAFPDRKWPANELAWLLKRRGSWREGARIAAILRDRFPDETSGYVVGAFCHRQAGAFAEAGAVLDLAEQVCRDQAWIGHERASGARAAEAAGLVDTALALAGSVPGGAGEEDSHRLRIAILSRQGRLAEARTSMAAAGLLFPDAIWLLADRVQEAVTQKRWVETLALAVRLRERQPEAAAGYRYGLQALRALRRLDEAGDLQRQAVARFPDDSWLHAEAARIMQDAGQVAREELQAAFAQKRWVQTITLAARMRERQPEEAAGYRFGMQALRALRRLDEAGDLQRQAVKRFLDDSWLHAEAARIAQDAMQAEREALQAAFVQKRWVETIALAAGVRERQPEQLAGYRFGIQALRAERRLDEAGDLQRQAAALFPDDDWLREEAARIVQDARHLEREALQAAFAQKRWVETIALAAGMRERQPEQLAGYRFGIQALRAERRLDDAGDLQRQAAALFPDDDWLREEAARIVQDARHLEREALQAAFAQKRWVETIALAAGLRQRQPEQLAGYRFGIQALRALQRLDEAGDLQRQAAARFPDDDWLHQEGGRIVRDARHLEREAVQAAFAQKRWVETIALAARMREHQPDEAAGYRFGIQALRAERRLVEAGDLQRRAAAHFPADIGLRAEAARIAHDARDWEREEQLWSAMRRRFPADPLAYEQGAGALQACARDDDAVALLDEAIAMFADNEIFYRKQARLAEYRMDWAGADDRWAEALRAFPDDREMRLQWATCRSRPPLLALRDLDCSIGRLQACVVLLPDHLPYHLALTATLQAAGQLAAAEQAVADALAMFPDSIDAKLAGAALLAARGETARALDAGRAAFRLDPSSLTGIAAFARLLIDAAAHVEADAVCEAGIARYPADLGLRRLYAEAAASREAFQAAHDRWLAAAAIWPDDAGILRELGEARIRVQAVAEVTSASDVPLPGRDEAGPGTESALAGSFESLGGTGQGCEFGVVQRQLGAEPLGLLRWTTILPEQLTAALDERFGGVGEPAQTIIDTFADVSIPEYRVRDRRYGMQMHTFLTVSEAPQEKVEKRILMRLSFLKRKFLEGLALHDKIYVYKLRERRLLDAEIDALFEALQAYGENWLLYVCLAEDGHPAGMVDVRRPRLMIGYITGFSIAPDGSRRQPDFVCWKKLCVAAKEIRQAGK